MGAIASQITSLTIVYSTVYADANQRKHQSSASLAFVRGIHRGPVNSPHKWPVTWRMFSFDDVIITRRNCARYSAKCTWPCAVSWIIGYVLYLCFFGNKKSMWLVKNLSMMICNVKKVYTTLKLCVFGTLLYVVSLLLCYRYGYATEPV